MDFSCSLKHHPFWSTKQGLSSEAPRPEARGFPVRYFFYIVPLDPAPKGGVKGYLPAEMEPNGGVKMGSLILTYRHYTLSHTSCTLKEFSDGGKETNRLYKLFL